MKKIIVSILALFYLCFSAGATVHFHYCMGKLVNWSLNSEGKKCTNCGMEKDDGCCKDEQKLVKNNSDQKTTAAIQLQQIAPVDHPHPLIETSESYLFSILEKNLISHSPPIKSGVDILVRNCVFRI